MEHLSAVFKEWSILSIFLRLFLATCAGIIVGMDREYKNKGAGIKTHALVCLGAALAMIVNEYVFHEFPGVTTDITRIGAQVVSGIGFLGVGTIIVTGMNEVKGLTTAAGLWACAGIGLASGVGFLYGTIISMGFVVLILKVLEPMDRYLRKNSRDLELFIEVENIQTVKSILKWIRANHIEIRNFNLYERNNGLNSVSTLISLKLSKHGEKPDFINKLRQFEGVIFTEEV